MSARTWRLSHLRRFIALLPVVLAAGCGWCDWGWSCGDDGTGTTDSKAPTVSLTDPADGAADVAIDGGITVTFSEAMDPSTITAATFTVTGPDGNAIAGTRAFDVANNLATFTPTGDLAPDTEYTVTITSGVEDLAGHGLVNALVQTFATARGTPVADTTAPTVSSTSPTDRATGVAINQGIAATFSEDMNASSIAAAFDVTGPGATSVTGTIAYDVASRLATFTPAGNLAINTAYTATLTTEALDAAGNGLTDDFGWSFTTAGTSDTTSPMVNSTNPANAATGAAINTKITATFSEAMNASTIAATTFTVVGPGTTPVSGSVTYAAAGSTATFTPVANLTPNTSYTATITTAVWDLAGNALAVDKTWGFTTAEDNETTDTLAPTVSSTNPGNAAAAVPINQRVNATFSEAMDPLTISTAHYTLTGPGATPIRGTVVYDVFSNISMFTPTTDLAPNTLFTATITTGVGDLAGNTLADEFVWTFTTTDTPGGQAPVDLRSASTFAVLAGAGVTNVNNPGTIVNGNMGTSPTPSVGGFPPGVLNGTQHASDPIAELAKLDLTAAYNDAAGRSLDVITVADGELGGLTLAPGLYMSAPGSFAITSVDLTLDAQGDANAVYIFQMPSSTLTVGNGRQVILSGGAKASNVFWQVGTSATLGTTCVFKGNIMADQAITLQTGATLEGRALARIAAVSLDTNVVSVPAP